MITSLNISEAKEYTSEMLIRDAFIADGRGNLQTGKFLLTLGILLERIEQIEAEIKLLKRIDE